MNKLTLAYLISAYNENLNIEELHRRWRLACGKAWQRKLRVKRTKSLGFVW